MAVLTSTSALRSYVGSVTHAAGRPDNRAVSGRTGSLLQRATTELHAAQIEADNESAYVRAHVAALKYAASALEVVPPLARERRLSVWVQLSRRIPAFAHWSQFFEAGAKIRQRLEVGLPVELSDDLVRDYVDAVGKFSQAVRQWLEQYGDLGQEQWRFAS